MADLLSQRALNRATLDRQLLLSRADMSVSSAVEHLVGLQAQAPFPPYFGLWTRLKKFHPDDVSQLLLDRDVVRIVLMRGTVHLVTADDCLALRPLMAPIMARALTSNTEHAPVLQGLDLDAVTKAGRALVEERPMTGSELGPLLAESWPDRTPASLAFAARVLLPLVQVPPRGIWGKSGQPRCTTAEAWLGRPLNTDFSLESMVLRYLTAFGPATVNDVQAWSGLTRLREIVEPLRPRLRTFRDDNGRELFDLPEVVHPDPDIVAPVRLLAPFDNLLLSHADRTRVISDEHRKIVITQNGLVKGTILVDGFVRGFWEIVRKRDTASLAIESFSRLSKKDTAALTREGNRLLEFAASDATSRDVRFTDVR